MDVILVPFSWRQTKTRHSPVFSRKMEKVRLKSSTAMDNIVHASRTRWQTRDNTVRDVMERKIDCSFVVPGTWYVSPSLISMDKTRQRRKTHMAAWGSEQAHTKDAKHAELWQLIKARRCYKLCWRFYCLFLPSSSSDHREIYRHGRRWELQAFIFSCLL